MNTSGSKQSPDSSSFEFLSGSEQFPPKRSPWFKILPIALAAILIAAILLGKTILQGNSSSVRNTNNHSSIVAMIDFQSNVGYGELTLNGKKILLHDAETNQIDLIAGLNTLQISVPPFPPRTCIVHWPPLQGDTCWDAQKQMISLPYLITDLPSKQQLMVQNTIHDFISSMTSHLEAAVPMGNLYANEQNFQNNTPAYDIAQSSLSGKLILSLLPQDSNCDNVICAGSQGGNNWNIKWPYKAYWQFTNTNGTQVGQSSPVTGTLSFSLNYTQGNSWQINEQFSSVEQSFYQQTCFLQIAQIAGAQSLSIQHSDATGCLADANPTPSTNFLNNDPIFFVRFGVVMAANSISHTKNPTFPTIPANEMPFFMAIVSKGYFGW